MIRSGDHNDRVQEEVSQQHELYVQDDFTEEEYERENVLAVAVIDKGLHICMRCGAGEAELDDYQTCDAYRMFKP